MQTIRHATNSFSWHPTYNTGVEGLSDGDILRQAAGAGAEAIEIDPARVSRSLLEDIGIELAGVSVGGETYPDWPEKERDRIVATAAKAAELGGSYAFTTTGRYHWGDPGSVTTESLEISADRINDLGRRVSAEGLQLLVHNHADCPHGHEAEMELLRSYVDPACALALFDIGWAYVPGGDPIALIAELGPRIGGFHFRNHRGSVPTETLADGDIDMQEVARQIRAISYSGWVSLELWHRKDTLAERPMIDCQRESLALLRELLG